jgi:NAD(P)-dependent dehydrogenase (short-subunit alcohol dehydrogenase family)
MEFSMTENLEPDEFAVGAPPAASATWVEKVTPDRFKGKTVIVTGAGSGIGLATALRIAKEGGRVVVVDISKERLDALLADQPDLDFVPIVGDISNDDDVAAIVAATNGTVHGLANIAGIMDNMTPLHEVDDGVWQRVFQVNVDGLFKVSRAVIPLMLDAGSGSIVNIASEAGIRGSAAGLAYTASKHAVVGITKSSAFMYAPSGLRINAVAPGPTRTNIEISFASPFGQARVLPHLALMPGLAEPAQLAASITFLLSDDGINVNGVVLSSDGGWSAT